MFADRIHTPQVISNMQSTPMVPPLSSRLAALPINFELSPIIREESIKQVTNSNSTDILQSNNFNPTLSEECVTEKSHNVINSVGEASTSSGFGNVLEPARIELSTWIGGTLHCQIFIILNTKFFKP